MASRAMNVGGSGTVRRSNDREEAYLLSDDETSTYRACVLAAVHQEELLQ